ncbi:hypothetical protein ACWFRF_15585 [Nocardia sp. NPDC055165]
MEDKDRTLFELCKQVYEKTGWSPGWWHTERHGIQQQDGTFKDGSIRTLPVITAELIAPAYTSDYILEKLPDALNSPSFNVKYRLALKKIDNWYFAEYSNHGWFRDMKSVFARKGYDTSDDSLAYAIKPVTADTPLKALLTLTLALHEAGELK